MVVSRAAQMLRLSEHRLMAGLIGIKTLRNLIDLSRLDTECNTCNIGVH